MAEKEKKSISVLSLLAWFFGIVFILAGMGILVNGAIWGGIITILCALVILPYTYRLIAEKLKIKITRGLKIVLLIVCFFIVGLSVPEQTFETSTPKASTPVPQPQEQKVFIDKTYNDLWAVFSPDSKYTDLQKEKLFNEQYKDKYVKWTGTVKDIDTTTFTDKLVLEVEHRPRAMFDTDGGDVTVYMKKDQYNKLIEISKDEQVTYSGKFNSFGDFMIVNFYLEDGEVIS